MESVWTVAASLVSRKANEHEAKQVPSVFRHLVKTMYESVVAVSIVDAASSDQRIVLRRHRQRAKTLSCGGVVKVAKTKS